MQPPPYNPYEAPAAGHLAYQALTPTLAYASQAELAGRGARFAAAFIDNIVTMAGMVVSVIGAMVLFPGHEDSESFGMVAAIVGLLPGLALELFAQIYWGQSVGKKVLGIRVTMLDGTAPSLARMVVLRNFFPAMIQVIPGIGSIFGLIDATAIFGEAKRCLHDHFASTKVVRDA